MGRSPKTGRMLEPEKGNKNPLSGLLDLIPWRDSKKDKAEEILFFEEDPVEDYWEENDYGLETVLDALDQLETEKRDYKPAKSWVDRNRLIWLEQMETYAEDLIIEYFEKEYGEVPREEELSDLEKESCSYIRE